MATRYVSDTARANWSSLASAIIGLGAAWWIAAVNGDPVSIDSTSFMINVFLVTWPAFGVIYLVWTHLSYSGRGPRALGSRARKEKKSQGRWWSMLLGYGGASSWTLMAAIIAVFVAIVVAQDAAYRSSFIYIMLGLLCVACSWALMVYAFALEYLQLDASSDIRHIGMELEGDAQFGDYLTLAILLSTMAATASAKIHTRKAWLLVRTNVLFAFTFNSVIVAMVVSLLLGALIG